MDDWWSDIDNEILSVLTAGPMEPVELARRLRVPESSVTSLMWGLVSQGKVRVCLVEATAATRPKRPRSVPA